MPDGLEKIAEKIPYSEGGLRRRFTSGGMIVFAVLFLIYESPTSSLETLTAKDLIASPVIALGLLVLIYAIGNIVEMIGELFIVRAVGETVWAGNRANEWWGRRSIPVRLLVFIPLVYFAGFYFYYHILRGLVGVSRYRWEVDKFLSAKATRYFHNLPETIQNGLAHPLGDHFDSAWKYLQVHSTEEGKQWLVKLDSRNKDILTITSSLIVVLLLLFFGTADVLPEDSQTVGTGFFLLSGVLVLLTLLPLPLFRGYFLMLRKSIVGALEIASINTDERQ